MRNIIKKTLALVTGIVLAFSGFTATANAQTINEEAQIQSGSLIVLPYAVYQVAF
ncbi:hypothetical protein BBOMB_1491 [Bifidobacterium bombi DSM 19703]|uniref:Uncharacterized protein n=1 Tax=Bifidobacterium bombi DSM 19703 TaxID=1341695 RepID=A0A086BNW1_9BIFI|nr:hypothetical protein BBOMB_1491 [Bifidobacterium bombi DSM 19703]